MRGRLDPVGRIALYTCLEISLSFLSYSNRRCIPDLILTVLFLLVTGPRSRNLVVLLRIVLIVITPAPLSGFVIRISLFFRRDLMA